MKKQKRRLPYEYSIAMHIPDQHLYTINANKRAGIIMSVLYLHRNTLMILDSLTLLLFFRLLFSFRAFGCWCHDRLLDFALSMAHARQATEKKSKINTEKKKQNI